MAFVPNSGAVSTDIISDVFGLGDDFNNYRGTIWYYPANLTYGYFSSGTIKSSDFYGKQPNDPATAGVLFSNTAGYGSFVVPLYRNSITIEIWGAGGGGGAVGSDGAKGGDTSIANYQPISGGTITTDYTAGGGKGGDKGIIPTPPPPKPHDIGGGAGKGYSYAVTSIDGRTVTTGVSFEGRPVGSVTCDISSGDVVGQSGDTGAYGKGP